MKIHDRLVTLSNLHNIYLLLCCYHLISANLGSTRLNGGIRLREYFCCFVKLIFYWFHDYNPEPTHMEGPLQLVYSQGNQINRIFYWKMPRPFPLPIDY